MGSDIVLLRIMLMPQELLTGVPRIKVVGVGCAGTNMVDWLARLKIQGAELIAVDTDKAHLDIVEADRKILIGKELTRGLGAGGDPSKGEEAAKASLQELKEAVEGADMVWILAGLGGGTGSGGAPVIAKLAKEAGVDLVIATVTMPFRMEGTVRLEKAEYALQNLQQFADNIIVIDNNKLLEIAGNLPLRDAFAYANNMIGQMIKGIVEAIAVPSLVNLDFADVRTVMTRGGGLSVVGIGESSSENRAAEAVRRALENPLLEVNYEGAAGAIVHVQGGPDMTLNEVAQIGDYVYQFMGPDSLVIWGARIDDSMEGRIRVTVIVSGVKSPYILGRKLRLGRGQRNKEKVAVVKDRDLGIDFLQPW